MPIEHKADWAPEPVWTLLRRGEPLASAGIRTPGRPAGSLATVPTTDSFNSSARKQSMYLSSTGKACCRRACLVLETAERISIKFSMDLRSKRSVTNLMSVHNGQVWVNTSSSWRRAYLSTAVLVE